MAANKFIVLKNKDLAVTKGATGCTRISFTQDDLDNITTGVKATTVTFDTLNPCVAVVDEDGVQWDLNSKRVRYNTITTKTTVDLIDILYAKGLITAPATIKTAQATYTRFREKDTDTGYAWARTAVEPTAPVDPPYRLYTKAEAPAVGDMAYVDSTTSGTNTVEITAVTNPAFIPITTDDETWDAIFTVSTVEPSGGTLSGIIYEKIDY